MTSGKWKYGLAVTLLGTLAVLFAGGALTAHNAPPIPGQAVDPNGQVRLTAADVTGGQAVFLKYGLMNYGSIMGNGAYKGPDFTALTLHLAAGWMRDFYARERFSLAYADLLPEQQAAVADQVARELKRNLYDPATDTLTLTAGQAFALEQAAAYYADYFRGGGVRGDLPADLIQAGHLPAGDRWVQSGDPIDQLSAYFFWTAWAAAARRPGAEASYTNNWPYDPAAGNIVTENAKAASTLSVVLLVLALAAILFIYRRYRLEMEPTGAAPPAALPDTVTPTQRVAVRFLVAVAAMFLVQTLLGGYMAHMYAEPEFAGLDTSSLLPFNVARGWHLQLAIFWIAAAWMAAGLYIAPLVSGEEPRRQALLANLLLGTLTVAVVGTLAGQWLGVKGFLGRFWFYLGGQGWEYVELGRVWQVLLLAALAGWLFIVGRGLSRALRAERDWGGLTHLLLYSSVGIPLFYVFGLFIAPGSHLTIADYWRWFVIHLWVEGFFEVFAVVVVAWLLTSMGLVRRESVLRAVYFQLILLLGSGVIGTGHHFYFSGAPEFWLALGATFSALEIVPLSLLVGEAYLQWRVLRAGGRAFPYSGTFRFLVATGVWNLVGAGGLGFLINLPVINYFEHGTWLTPAHAHAAMAGVYGMLAVALMLYVLRGVVQPEAWNERLVRLACWGLNAGLAGMVFLILVPVGFMQLAQAVTGGYWTARLAEFYLQPPVRALLWLRLLPDGVFIGLGVAPLLMLTLQGLRHMRPANGPAPRLATRPATRLEAARPPARTPARRPPPGPPTGPPHAGHLPAAGD